MATGKVCENLVKFAHVVFHSCGFSFRLCQRTDRQTDSQIAILRTPPGNEVTVLERGTYCLRMK